MAKNRALYEKLSRIEKAEQERARARSPRRKKKTRPASVQCALCGRTGVAYRDTAETPLGRACLSHEGVGS